MNGNINTFPNHFCHHTQNKKGGPKSVITTARPGSANLGTPISDKMNKRMTQQRAFKYHSTLRWRPTWGHH